MIQDWTRQGLMDPTMDPKFRLALKAFSTCVQASNIVHSSDPTISACVSLVLNDADNGSTKKIPTSAITQGGKAPVATVFFVDLALNRCRVSK